MADTILGRLVVAVWPTIDQKHRVDVLASLMLDWACLAPLVVIGGMMPYGRYGRSSKMLQINARLGWILQELPSFAIPLYVLMTSYSVQTNLSMTSLVLLTMFMVHYGYRVIIYSYCIRGGKPSPLPFFLAATFFCTTNGYMQANYLLKYSSYPDSWLYEWNFILGFLIFCFGFYTNTRCDTILRNLRKPGETGYKIPRGWVFEYVSGGNYFGEAVEWSGWALACWSPQGLAFAAFATTFLGARSYSHHRWYKENFKNYPKDRKAFVPFLF